MLDEKRSCFNLLSQKGGFRAGTNYDPNSVPQYWLGGAKVGLSSLKLNRPLVAAAAIAEQSILKVDWPRYQIVGE